MLTTKTSGKSQNEMKDEAIQRLQQSESLPIIRTGTRSTFGSSSSQPLGISRTAQSSQDDQDSLSASFKTQLPPLLRNGNMTAASTTSGESGSQSKENLKQKNSKKKQSSKSKSQQRRTQDQQVWSTSPFRDMLLWNRTFATKYKDLLPHASVPATAVSDEPSLHPFEARAKLLNAGRHDLHWLAADRRPSPIEQIVLRRNEALLNAEPSASESLQDDSEAISKEHTPRFSSDLQARDKQAESAQKGKLPARRARSQSNNGKGKRHIDAFYSPTPAHQPFPIPRAFLSAEKQDELDQRNEGITTESSFIRSAESRKEIAENYHFDSLIDPAESKPYNLGEGNFAIVLRCLSMKDGQDYAIKEVDKRKLRNKHCYIENEVHLLSKCRHPNIMRIIEAYQTPHCYFIVMELMENGDLFDAIKNNGSLSDHRSARIVKQVAAALSYLHQRRIVHRVKAIASPDVKPENILLGAKSHAKLIDFGLACKMQGPLYRICGTPTYVAPEVLLEQGYGLGVDIWSLGVITYIMLCGYAPFRHENRTKLFELIQRGKVSFESAGWDKISQDGKEFISQLLRANCNERPTADEVLKQTWVKNTT